MTLGLVRVRNFTRRSGYKFWKVSPNKIWEGEKRPKFGAISDNFTIFDFDRKYLWNGSTWRKSENYIINYNPLLLDKKFGELWSTNIQVIGVSVVQPKWIGSGNYISAVNAAAASNFYTRYDP